MTGSCATAQVAGEIWSGRHSAQAVPIYCSSCSVMPCSSPPSNPNLEPCPSWSAGPPDAVAVHGEQLGPGARRPRGGADGGWPERQRRRAAAAGGRGAPGQAPSHRQPHGAPRCIFIWVCTWPLAAPRSAPAHWQPRGSGGGHSCKFPALQAERIEASWADSDEFDRNEVVAGEQSLISCVVEHIESGCQSCGQGCNIILTTASIFVVAGERGDVAGGGVQPAGDPDAPADAADQRGGRQVAAGMIRTPATQICHCVTAAH